METECKERILLVDDDETLLSALAQYLELLGYDVVEATSGNSAIAIIDDSIPDLVVSDVEMPDGSGVDLLRSIRERDLNIPVIIQTGRPKIEAAVECVKLGASDYLSKPVDPIIIKDMIRDVLSRKDDLSNTLTIRADDRGRILGGYRVVRVLGEGSFGTVFLVEKGNGEERKKYALKILKTHVLRENENRDYMERFIHEAEAASQVVHPNIIEIVEFGIADEEPIPFIVMGFVDGRSLGDLIHDPDQLNYCDKVKILIQIAGSLGAIHDKKIYHRDIKPDNIIIDGNMKPVLTDFGVARLPESELTMTNMVLGTPSYLSPEGFMTAKVDNRSDIFSFGVVAYEFLLGKKPFIAENLPHLAHLVNAERPIEPRKAVDNFPVGLQFVLAKMLRKRPKDRYQSAHEVVRDLKELLESGLTCVPSKRIDDGGDVPSWS